MVSDLRRRLDSLAADDMLRHIPDPATARPVTDLSVNDYLGLAADPLLQERFMDDRSCRMEPLASSASRLLSARQEAYASLEHTLDTYYPGRRSLLFNSGYHANTGMVAAVARLFANPLILADKLVHASIIDGIILSRARFNRFPHNRLDRLEQMLARVMEAPERPDGVVVIVESVYSMDGDRADIERLIDIKRRWSRPGTPVMLYVDEAHAIGAAGPSGLGLVEATADPCQADIVIGTFGKALASSGAFAVMGADLREWAVNSARSFIFSTSIPPLVARWSEYMLREAVEAQWRRDALAHRAALLDPADRRYIYPAITGSATAAVRLSQALLDELAIKVLPIRTPTVPPGTERLRISLSATTPITDIERLRRFLDTHTAP